MSETSPETPPERKFPSAPDLRPVVVPDAPSPTAEQRDDGPRDLSPIIWGATLDDADDFRPRAVTVDAPDPKDWSAAVSADFSAHPVVESLSDALATTAPAAKDSTPIKAPELSKPPSSLSQKNG